MSTFICASHGRCLDGLASAALMSDLVQQLSPGTKMSYRALTYGAQVAQVKFNGSGNALLDFRYIRDPNLSFYIDHHPTAFLDADAKQDFEKKQSANPRHFVHDVAAKSCANLIARLAMNGYGYQGKSTLEIESFAQKIDAAEFETVDEAIELSTPLMRMVCVVTHYGDDAFYNKAIPIMLREGMHGLAEQKWVSSKFRRLAPSIQALNERMKQKGRMQGRVVVIDLVDSPSNVISKFRQYYEFPSATYSIIISKTAEAIRISIGHNPWSGQNCDIDIGSICQSFGGGGHFFVGAISLGAEQVARAMEITQSIANRLQYPDQNE